MKKQRFFDSTIKLFEVYRSKMLKGKHQNYNSHLSNEIHYRLWQLSFIYEKLQHYDQEVTKPPTTAEMRKSTRFLDEGIVFAETFYFIAWRIILIATGNKKIKPLLCLKGLKNKAKGVVLVRNNLILHPEDKKFFMVSFAWNKNGPILKPGRAAGETFEIVDRGLWINAKEFKDGLEKLLQDAINNH